MAGNADAVRVDGVRELVRAIGRVEPGLRKELGQRNKAIGQRIIDQAYPKPTNVLRIIAGGSSRTRPVQQWGRRPADRGGVKRPYIRRSAEQQMPQIEKEYMDALLDVARKAGLKTGVGRSLS
jgi:hypothetical protein